VSPRLVCGPSALPASPLVEERKRLPVGLQKKEMASQFRAASQQCESANSMAGLVENKNKFSVWILNFQHLIELRSFLA
jgi:hypothetical protein